MCESTAGVPVCLTLCLVCVCVNYVEFTLCVYKEYSYRDFQIFCDVCVAFFQFCSSDFVLACTHVKIPGTSVCLFVFEAWQVIPIQAQRQ